MNSTVPFAVCGSNDFITKENGVKIRVRKYAWGVVEGLLHLFLQLIKFS